MFTQRKDVITIREFAKLLSGHSATDFKTKLDHLMRAYPLDSARLNQSSATCGYQTITYSEARYFCSLASCAVPKGLAEPVDQINLKEQLTQAVKNELDTREALTEMLQKVNDNYIYIPDNFGWPPHDLQDLLTETIKNGEDCRKPEALATAKKLAETSAWFYETAKELSELQRQLEGGHANA